jgi:hypothetical protein
VAEFDLNLFPFYRIKGQERPQLPGLLAVQPPKKTARGREDDRLMLYLTLAGNTPFTLAEYNQLASDMLRKFFGTSGALTSAIRSSVDSLNRALLERNLRTTGQGQYIIGRLILGVLRGAQFVLAQSGPTNVFHFSGGENRQVHDAQSSGRGLGFSQTAPLYFAQADLHPGDLLVMSTNLPPAWEAALLEEKAASVDALRRKLLSLRPDDLNAVLIQSQPGQGAINILKTARLDPEAHGVAKAVPPAQAADGLPAAAPPPSRPTSTVESGKPASRFTRLLAGDPAAEPTAGEVKAKPPPSAATQAAVESLASTPLRTRAVRSTSGPQTAARAGRFAASRSSNDLPEIARPASAQGREFFRSLARLVGNLRLRLRKASAGLKTFLPRLLPGLGETEPESGGSGLGILALAVPLILVVVSVLVYTQYGRAAQYQEYFDLARQQTALVSGQTDPNEIRRLWDSTLFYLDKAQSYQKTQEAADLRLQAQTALDNLDSILRLDFHLAIVGGLSRSVQVSHMAATNTDLYLLDATRGSVIRAAIGSQGYEVDENFTCGPGQYGETIVGPLIDISALQASNIYNARLLGMDSNGTLLYCGFNMQPVAVSLVPPPLNWRGISAFTLGADEKNLYVLDPSGNAIWVYGGSFGEFPAQPTIFFGEQVPQGMSSAIDLAANTGDLYLLFQDGHITACPLSHYDVVRLRCTDPVTFVDTRPGQQSGSRLNDGIFTQITFASAPDPSVYMLEPLTRAVYRFSPRPDSVELRAQFRATPDLSANADFSRPATAMAISPNRYLFLSLGNQVYFASDVP